MIVAFVQGKVRPVLSKNIRAMFQAGLSAVACLVDPGRPWFCYDCYDNTQK